MRENKFRGKRIDNGEWVYGGFHKHQLKTPSPIIMNGKEPKEIEYAYLILESGFSDWNLPTHLLAHEVIPETVAQFTGFRDSKRTNKYPEGQEIYDDDLIKGDGYGPYPVFWDDGHCGWCSCCYSDAEPISTYKNIEVVGNVHDHHDLLETVE